MAALFFLCLGNKERKDKLEWRAVSVFIMHNESSKFLDNSNGMRYYRIMIVSFKDNETELVYKEQFSKKLPRNIQHTALRKLIVLHHAVSLEDLRIPPGNKLELLHGDRKGQHSIRINDQWRVWFTWKNNNAHDAEIVDYH